MKLPHRDDASDELLNDLAEKFPGFKIVFAGDNENSLPQETLDAIKLLDEMHENSLNNGSCIDCGAQMPGWPEISVITEGWKYFTEVGEDDPIAYICPACDEAEEEGVIYKV